MAEPALAVATSVYLAAVWLTADAARAEREDLIEAFRKRALAAGVVAGAVALGGLLVVRADAERIYDGLVSGAGLVGVAASAAAGAATMIFVARRPPEPARWSAAVAVAAIVSAWALAQQPQLLPGLSVAEAAAGDATLVALLVSLAIGAVILVPSLILLFGLVLRGRFDERPEEPGTLERAGRVFDRTSPAATRPERVAAGAAAACALFGVPLTLIFEAGVPLTLGVCLLLASVAAGAAYVVPKVALGEARDE